MSKLNTYHFLKVVLLNSLFVFLYSCTSAESVKICKVGDKILYENDLLAIQDLFYSQLSYEESRDLAIELWANQQRIAMSLQESNPGIKSRNELQAMEDLALLNLFELENEYIKSHLDSLINEEEIQAYYTANRDNYKTQSYIVKALYISIPDTMPENKKIERHYLLKNDKDREEIEKIANLYAANFYYDENSWIYIDDLLRGVPITPEDRERMIKEKGNLMIKSGGEAFYINIFDAKTKSVSSPLESEIEKIRNDILKQKVSNLRSKAKEIILNDVKEKYPVTYF